MSARTDAVKNKLSKHDEKVLANFLRQHRKDNALSLLQAKGFLFIVACCPDVVQPSEWLPLIWAETQFSDGDEAQQISGYLITLYNQMNSQILNRTAKLPKECRQLPDTMSNFVDPAPIHQWAQGFMKGYSWLMDSWEELFENNPDSQPAFSMIVMILGVAADLQSFEKVISKDQNETERVRMAKNMLTTMPTAIKEFANMALLVRDQVSAPNAYNSGAR